MSPHRVYVEPFLGGGSVLLNKPKAEREVAGDLDADLIATWRALAGRGDEVVGYLAALPYDSSTFEAAKAYLEFTLEVADGDPRFAAAYLVRNRFSRGGLGQAFAWSDRLRGGQPGDANAWDTIRAELPAIAERVRDVEFHCRDALVLIERYDSPETLTYADPPYVHETRTTRQAYAHEMTSGQHRNLLHVLRQCRGAVLLSGYHSELYDNLLADWHRTEWDLPNHSGQGKVKQRRVECVWRNSRAMEV